jgi:hypothetical protein
LHKIRAIKKKIRIRVSKKAKLSREIKNWMNLDRRIMKDWI